MLVLGQRSEGGAALARGDMVRVLGLLGDAEEHNGELNVRL